MKLNSYFRSNIFILTLYFILPGCNKSDNKTITILKGNIPNLPDGKIYAQDKILNIIDSTMSKNGIFKFNLPKDSLSEPVYAQLMHVATKDSVKRRFLFKTSTKIRGYPLWTSLIMLEENGSELNGTMTEYNDAYKSKTIDIAGN